MCKPNLLLLAAALLPGVAEVATAQGDAVDAPVEKPAVLYASPLGALAGQTTKVTLRGLHLQNATAVHWRAYAEDAQASDDKRPQVKFLSAGAAAPPNGFTPAKAGDSEVVFELTAPDSLANAILQLVVETPGGESTPLALRVDAPANVVLETEPNNGFAQAQQLSLGQTVLGVIQQAKDVDVFRFAGDAGQTVVCEVFAARLGSPADLHLMLFTATGQLIDATDDQGNNRDPRLESKLPARGEYHLVVLEAQDAGGNPFPYRLEVRK